MEGVAGVAVVVNVPPGLAHLFSDGVRTPSMVVRACSGDAHYTLRNAHGTSVGIHEDSGDVNISPGGVPKTGGEAHATFVSVPSPP